MLCSSIILFARANWIVNSTCIDLTAVERERERESLMTASAE